MNAQRVLRCAAALVIAIGGASCAREATVFGTADGVVRSIYSGNVVQTQQAFDEQTRQAVTPESVSELAQRMRGIGRYLSISPVSSMKGGRYDFEAQFEHGSMLVQLRLDDGGKIAALHVVPNEPPPSL